MEKEKFSNCNRSACGSSQLRPTIQALGWWPQTVDFPATQVEPHLPQQKYHREWSWQKKVQKAVCANLQRGMSPKQHPESFQASVFLKGSPWE